MMQKILTSLILLAVMSTGLFSAPQRSLAQSADCGVKENPGSNLDLPPANQDPTITPSPFNPDLGYSKIKDCLPVSNFDNSTWQELLAKIFETLSYLIGFLAIFGLIISGIMYITAGGDQDKAEKARRNIVWIVIGILIYMFALYFLPLIRSVIVQALSGA